MSKARIALLLVALAACISAITKLDRVAVKGISSREGAEILYALNEDLERRGFVNESIVKIKGDLVVVAEGVPTSWWSELKGLNADFRLITDGELSEVGRGAQGPRVVMHLGYGAKTREGHPSFLFFFTEYYWLGGRWFGKPSGHWIHYTAVKSGGIWRAIWNPSISTP